MLDAVEAVPPGAAADAMGAQLAEALGAREVGFLIADFSGRSLVRLGHDGSRAMAEVVGLLGSPQGRALETQEVVVAPDSDGTRLFAPVTIVPSYEN